MISTGFLIAIPIFLDLNFQQEVMIMVVAETPKNLGVLTTKKFPNDPNGDTTKNLMVILRQWFEMACSP